MSNVDYEKWCNLHKANQRTYGLAINAPPPPPTLPHPGLIIDAIEMGGLIVPCFKPINVYTADATYMTGMLTALGIVS